MASPLPILLIFLSLSLSESKLSENYYKTSCPNFEKIVLETVTTKQISNPTTAAGALRLFFHDCMVGGCDASILVSYSSSNPHPEREADINLSLSGDAFEVITKAKTTLELSCPRIVSCSDILAQATRDLVIMVGGPYYPVLLGRKDSLVSLASQVERNLPRANTSMSQIIQIFASKGFTVQEMVALTGAHTIGFSHCKEFADRIGTDGDLNPKYADALKKLCANYTVDETISAFNDVYTPGKFDNMYYKNLLRGLGLLASDNAMVKDPRTKMFVDLYAANETAFFQDFAHAMEKASVYGVKTGPPGEVRSRCDLFN